MRQLLVNELFAGIGAQERALCNLEIPHKIVGISEIDKWCVKSYTAIHGDTYNYGDISQIDALKKADLWTYSFPCNVLIFLMPGKCLEYRGIQGVDCCYRWGDY